LYIISVIFWAFIWRKSS